MTPLISVYSPIINWHLILIRFVKCLLSILKGMRQRRSQARISLLPSSLCMASPCWISMVQKYINRLTTLRNSQSYRKYSSPSSARFNTSGKEPPWTSFITGWNSQYKSSISVAMESRKSKITYFSKATLARVWKWIQKRLGRFCQK